LNKVIRLFPCHMRIWFCVFAIAAIVNFEFVFDQPVSLINFFRLLKYSNEAEHI